MHGSALDEPAVARLIDQVRAATAARTPLRIQGGGTKTFYGRPIDGEVLDTTAVAGITSYEPSELVVTARAGTPISDVEAALHERGQCLAFEPPHFAPGGTVGGMVAAGLSGPGRATAGAVRDHVLGTALLNGHAQVLRFGGQVIKNVAGYDVSRVLAGSLGTLGVLLEVSLRVAPQPPARTTLRFALGEDEAVRQVNTWIGQALPVHASAWVDGTLTVRLQGAAPAVDSAARRLGGTVLDAEVAQAFWTALRDQQADVFTAAAGQRALWRLSVPPTTGPLALEPTDSQLIEWHGGLRWVHTHALARHMFNLASRAGGHATLFRPAQGAPLGPVFMPLAEPIERIHRALKQAFDPAGIFNAGRIHPAH
ncbi:glycolate oxidase subunit GlcE [Achromobacter sp. GG226]|uniref:glycolate oxidase subunit GlcE n=1 Tax=Verticiella alkaliphila TaxID=2779529 RepID=UPI001C0DDA1F|nr:glycolate oxidase subunit GlcE [Verticiella sp. GG226]MBU4611970.1 glycolate oxidase subunit GlcE [Verticiella sp. GG226]